MKTFGVIMAGGGGTRFWPLSRQEHPKQLLNLSGKDIMVNETIERILSLTDRENIFIVTNSKQEEKMKEATGGLILSENILVEPTSRNTAACIGFAAQVIVKKYGDGVMCIFPSDHHIGNLPEFTRVIREAIKIAENENTLLTMGIAPTFPCTGYGYIRYEKDDKKTAKHVIEFKEKPDEVTAKEYVSSGEYLWNAGMFVWKASTILKAMQQLLPEMYLGLSTIGDSIGTPVEQQIIRETYLQLPSISIDYGIMEKSSNVKVLEADFGWSDVGAWDNINDLYKKDEDNNIIVGNSINIDTKDSIIFSNKRLISTVGVDNLIIVETDDAIMVCNKNRAQDVKLIVDELKKKNMENYL